MKSPRLAAIACGKEGGFGLGFGSDFYSDFNSDLYSDSGSGQASEPSASSLPAADSASCGRAKTRGSAAASTSSTRLA